MRLQTLALITALMISNIASAALVAGNIEKVTRDKTHALLRIDTKLNLKKDDKIFLSPNCKLNLMKVKRNTAIANVESCNRRDLLKVGTTLQFVTPNNSKKR